MIAECREIHAPSWTRILLNAQKRFPRVQDLQRGSREVLGHVARISRRAARFSSRDRETISRCWKISIVFQKISNVFWKISNVFRKISNVFWNRSEFFSLTAPLSLSCQLRATTSAAYFTMSSSLFLHVECVVHALLFSEEIAAVVVVGLDFHRHIFHYLKAIGF